MFSWIRKLYDWMGAQVHKKHAEPILGFLFYLEAIFFLPTDPMLILYCIERQERAVRYATIATIASVLGGVTSYALGFTLWYYWGESIIHSKAVNYILSPKNFESLRQIYQQHEWLAILTAGFSPIPYKAATLSAGFCQLSLFPFITCSIIARGARFFLCAGVIKIFGIQIKNIIDRYFNLIALMTIGIVALILWTFT